MLTYDKDIPWQEFAKLTIETDDLDPVYVALHRSNMPEAQLMRWCAAFITYYHMGTASQLCELQGDDFWTELWNRYDTNPRAAERRHFRGDAGKRAMKAWINEYKTPEKFFAACIPSSFMKLLQKGVPQVGTYFTWKCMDLREAVFGYDTNWDEAEHHLVGLPMSGIEYLFPECAKHGPRSYSSGLLEIADGIKHHLAPPRHVRSCGIPEAETVACMLKAYYMNEKPIGKDIVEKRHDLTGYGAVSDYILSNMPEEPFTSKETV